MGWEVQTQKITITMIFILTCKRMAWYIHTKSIKLNQSDTPKVASNLQRIAQLLRSIKTIMNIKSNFLCYYVSIFHENKNITRAFWSWKLSKIEHRASSKSYCSLQKNIEALNKLQDQSYIKCQSKGKKVNRGWHYQNNKKNLMLNLKTRFLRKRSA